MARYSYFGDVSLAYGGTFYNFSDWKYGYVSAVEVTDLDSAAGFTGAVMIEEITILVDRERKDLESALSCCGASFLPNGDISDNGQVIKKNTSAYRHCLAYCCQAYGFKDTDRSEIVQLERDAPMTYDGWRADKRLRANASLRNYVRKNWFR